jgi:tRNA U34 5-methylaminomethyl-2-thiouridine-forming methyltransferase MnmC
VPGKTFSQRKLVDAKDWSAGFVRSFEKRPKLWEDKLDQAARQLKAAGKTKVEWVISDKAAAAIVRRELKDAGFGAIRVTYRAMRKR